MSDISKNEKKNTPVKKKKAWASLDELLNPSTIQISQAQITTAPNYEPKAQDHAQYAHNAPALNDDAPPAQTMQSQISNDLNTSSKVNTKEIQSEHKRNTSADTVNPISEHKEDTKETQKESPSELIHIKTLKKTQNEHKRNTSADTVPNTNANTNFGNHAPESIFNSLSGNELKVLVYLYELFIESTNYTVLTTYEKLAFFSSVNTGSIKTTTRRLSLKNLFNNQTLIGRGKKEIYLEANMDMIKFYSKNRAFYKAKLNLVNTDADTAPNTNANTKPSSKIDSIYNNTNYLTGEPDTNETQATTQQQAQNLGWFKSLNFLAIPYIKPMMVNSAIRTLVETKLDPDDVQMFINKFKNWLVTQNRIQNPLAIFCDKLKEFANEGDSPVLAVMSDEEMQVEYLMAQDLEKKRAEMDLINKARAFKQEQGKEDLFQEWLSQASDEEKKSIYPESGFAKYGSDIYNLGLKQAYLDSVKNG